MWEGFWRAQEAALQGGRVRTVTQAGYEVLPLELMRFVSYLSKFFSSCSVCR